MKRFYTLVSLFFAWVLNAQVGIGTTNPQQELHIAGANSTIRIEGLNAVNNINNDGVNAAPVMVNANGDLILGEVTPSSEVDLQGTSLIASPINITSATGAWTTVDLATGNFNLTKDKWVSGTYEIAVANIVDSSGAVLTDGAPRMYSIIVYIDGVQVSRDSKFYTCSNTGGGVTIASGYMVLSGTFFENLTAGNHTYRIAGTVFGGTFDCQGSFGGATAIDRLQILGL